MELQFILRLLLSVVCGAVIGFERKSRSKDAGLRTHIIVAIGSCLIMIISKYGFNDILANENYKVDAARLAAQVISGVGFLGAGMIFIRKNVISGLSTAAGIWTVSGIGLAIGAGMYLLGVFTTLIVVAVQTILNWNGLSGKVAHQHHYFITVDSREDIKRCNDFLKECGAEIAEFTFKQLPNSNAMQLSYALLLPLKFDEHHFVELATEQNYIQSIEI